jgi:hypothetical protein
MSTSVSVLSACSGDKALDAVVSSEDIDARDRTELIDRFPEASMKARSLYTGDEHEYIKAAVERFGELGTVEWRIISAGFGVVEPDTVLPSYECTFRDDDSVRQRVENHGRDPASLTKAERIQVVARELGIPTAIDEWLDRSPDILFVVLGQDYLIAADSALSEIPDQTTAFAFAANGTREQIGQCRWVPSTDTERAALQTTWTRVKGMQLRNVAETVSSVSELSTLSSEAVRELSH